MSAKRSLAHCSNVGVNDASPSDQNDQSYHDLQLVRALSRSRACVPLADLFLAEIVSGKLNQVQPHLVHIN